MNGNSPQAGEKLMKADENSYRVLARFEGKTLTTEQSRNCKEESTSEEKEP